MSLIRNSFFNVAGYVVPTMVAIPALGYLARTLGAERFGLFTLAMALVGYAGIFDAGMTRAVIREVSIFRDNNIEKEKIASTAVFFVLILGSIGACTMFLLASSIGIGLNVSEKFNMDVVKSLHILSFSIPIFLVNQIWLAVLEGEEKFFNVNLQKWISSSFLAGLPAMMLMIFEPSLSTAISGLLLGRVCSLIVTICFSYKFIIKSGFKFYKYVFTRLIKYGGWITVSNIISPIMSYFDRFIVSHLSGAHLVAFYSAPAEAVARLSIIPAALSRAVFPKLSFSINEEEKKRHLKVAYLLLAIVCIPIVIFCIIFSKTILVIWFGSEFGGVSATIFKILLIGYLFNCFAQIPFATIQAAGKAKLTATLHMFELLPYLIFLFLAVNYYGVVGAAVAWASRMVADSILLAFISNKIKCKK